MKPGSLIVILIILTLGILGFRTINQFFEVDDCLDHGGRWNEDCNCCEKSDPVIRGISCVRLGNYFANDTLNFISTSKVEYFMGELEWIFDSEYEQSNDTIIIYTKTFAFEMDDVSKLQPNLKQKYLLTEDSLILLSLQNRMGEVWKSADSDRLKRINNFFKIK